MGPLHPSCATISDFRNIALPARMALERPRYHISELRLEFGSNQCLHVGVVGWAREITEHESSVPIAGRLRIWKISIIARDLLFVRLLSGRYVVSGN